MTTKTIREVALDLYKPPFTYEHGYIFDSTHQMVADSGDIGEMRDLLITRIRGWGRIQYMDNPKGRAAALQDEVGQIVVEALNAFWGVTASDLNHALVAMKLVKAEFTATQLRCELDAANLRLANHTSMIKGYQAQVEALTIENQALWNDRHTLQNQRDALLEAGLRARHALARDRDALSECHTGPDGEIDRDGARGVAEINAVIAQIDSAVEGCKQVHPAPAPTRPAVPGSEVAVNAGALQMVRNALQRDADEGKQSRREMLAELEATIRPLAAAPQADAQKGGA